MIVTSMLCSMGLWGGGLSLLVFGELCKQQRDQAGFALQSCMSVLQLQ